LRYWGYPEHTQSAIADRLHEGLGWKMTSGSALGDQHLLWYLQNRAPNGLVRRTGLQEADTEGAPVVPERNTPAREGARYGLLEELKRHIAQGRPVIALGYAYGPPAVAPVQRDSLGKQYRVAVGYDETAQPPTIAVMDPSTSTKEQVWSEELFLDCWDVSNPAGTPARGWNLWMLIYDPRSASGRRTF